PRSRASSLSWHPPFSDWTSRAALGNYPKATEVPRGIAYETRSSKVGNNPAMRHERGIWGAASPVRQATCEPLPVSERAGRQRAIDRGLPRPRCQARAVRSHPRRERRRRADPPPGPSPPRAGRAGEHRVGPVSGPPDRLASAPPPLFAALASLGAIDRRWSSSPREE